MRLKRLVSGAVVGAVLLGTSGCGIQSIPQAQNDVEAAWAEVVNQFKRRADLIPNLVEVVKKYASHEKETLTAVVEARAKATATTVDAGNLTPEKMRQFEQASAGLSGALSRLMVVAERYPDLKANENFRDLQAQLEGTENRITVARQRYIESVRRFNNLVTVIPTSWTNSIFYKYEKKPQFTVENEKAISEPPKVSF
jgi:LemA protein